MTAAWLALAGIFGGVLGTAGAITSLVTYPALLAAGLPPYEANIANLVAVLACWPGSALASRGELRGTGPQLARTLPLAAAGSLAGAGLLLATPGTTFERVVPFLVFASALVMLLQPRLTRLRADSERHSVVVTAVAVAAVSLYSGYFGAGSGMMYLALLLVLTADTLPRANAVKNMIVGAAALTSAALFVATADVVWSAVVPLAAGEFVGSLAGPWVARTVPVRPLRWTIAALGVALAVDLWWQAF